MVWTIVVTAVATALVFLVALNFRKPKQLERKLSHKYAVDDAQFRREMGVMLGPAVIAGNRVTDLENGDRIFPAMLEAIAGARKTITFETYIYWSGVVGKKFSKALSERARAGVKVHVTIDWHGGNKLMAEHLEEMKSAGVDVRVYRPLRWYNIGRLNNRTHRKLLVVDGRIGFTGGVGIADEWMGDAQDPDHWRDMHFRVEGPVVAQLQAAFNNNWIKTTGEVLNGADYFPTLEPVGDVDANLFVSSPTGGSESMHLMFLMVIAAAERSIDLSAAYFVPDPVMMHALVAARERGVRIRILVPGKHIDSEAVRLASKSCWGALIQAGIEIHEFQPTMIHNKLLVADGRMASVGSTNFDMRSFQLNDEASLNIYDEDFASRMVATFEQDLARATQYSYAMWEARPRRDKLMEKFLLPIRSQL
jgi:cardiolipin synthase